MPHITYTQCFDCGQSYPAASPACPYCEQSGQDKGNDPVHHPEHYKSGGIETIDFIRAKLEPEGFQAYCVGNVMKYLTRYKHKNGLEDLKKANVYLQWAIESMESQTPAE